jgi:nucleoside-diphosphate-sugar epimerase/2-polyprenyl-3-methyl-5-hydroxy-6-metoxy-1,4-benzoquinol methylase
MSRKMVAAVVLITTAVVYFMLPKEELSQRDRINSSSAELHLQKRVDSNSHQLLQELPTTDLPPPPLPRLVVRPPLPVPQSQAQPPPQQTRDDRQKRKLIVVGGAGYVGSALVEQLKERYHIIATYDRNARAAHFPWVTRGLAKDIPEHVLQQAEAVVYLGGFTGRVVCDANPWERVLQENVHDVVTFARRMKPAQTLFFASTSAIGEGYGSTLFTEEDTPKTDAFDSYTRSMRMREVAMEELVADRSNAGSLPRLVAMRFGTVIGISPSQRVEFVHLALARSALLDGRITVRHPETSRSFLALRDLAAAIDTMLQRASELSSSHLNLFHLVSFSGTVGQTANEVASVIGVPVTFVDHEGADVVGFSLSATKFVNMFHPFEFRVTEQLAIKEILEHIEHLKLGRELLDRPHVHHDHEGPRCRVCGSTDIHEALDLGDQPLANDFQATAEEALQCPRFPLRLHRCRKCRHAQLSVSVDRKSLFSNYSYRSGTSRTLDVYFKWLATRVDKEVREAHGGAALGRPFRVLELACNDGTQLNQFKRLGWGTFGVDPAANLVVYARENGHTVATGLWGATPGYRYPELPETVDAIVAQNVLAHVPDPNAFLAAIVDMMHDKTLVYLQTSQCEMFHDGQFDTIYHEHISFFSPSSFRVLAERQGLRIIKYEITPIHGGSCFVTLVKASSTSAPTGDASLEAALALDEKRGIMGDVFYVEYRARVQAMRRWTISTLESAAAQGIRIVGYGAAAKGMVLLLYMLSLKPKAEFDYVVDDALLKQNKYCPGTRIPIKPTAELDAQLCDRDMLIAVFSWNFWEEIRGRITAAMKGNVERCSRTSVWVVLPFPVQRLVSLNLRTGEATTVLTNPFDPPKLPLVTLAPARRRVALVSHFYNEELLLPYFINQHASMFDAAVLIDCGSTDKSVEVIKRLAPSTWRVVRSNYPDVFHFRLVDEEVTKWENTFPGWWKVTLTTTEFLVHHDLRGYLHRLENTPRYQNVSAFRLRSLEIVGTDDVPLGRFAQLAQQRSEYLAPRGQTPFNYTTQYSRFLHRVDYPTKNRYHAGRHSLKGLVVASMLEEGFISKFKYSPWPQMLARKLQIGPRIPKEHFRIGAGIQHNTNYKALNEQRAAIRGLGTMRLGEIYFSCKNDVTISVHDSWYRTLLGKVVLRTGCDNIGPASVPLPSNGIGTSPNASKKPKTRG